jgi:hypothetical protein
MRKFLLGVLLLPALAFSAEPVEVNKTVVCDSARDMIPFFGKKYQETPLWIGEMKDSTVTLLVNVETQTWSMVQFNIEQDIACLIDSGTGFKFKLPNLL